MTDFLRVVSVHIRVGYTTALALGLTFLCALGLIEAQQAHSLGVDLFVPIIIEPRIVLLAIFYTGCLLVVLPILIAPLIAFSRGRTILTRALRARGRYWTISILSLGLLNGFLVVYLGNLQRFGGVSVSLVKPYDHGYALSSAFLWFEQHIPRYLIIGVPAALSAIRLSQRFFGWPKPQSFRDYLARLQYQALPARFAPRHGRRRLNFNVGGLAPALRGARKEMVRDMDVYQAQVPGSEDARRYLVSVWNDCKTLLQEMGVSESAGRQIRLFGSTSRALDRALAESPVSYRIVLSPYEHPTERFVAAGYGQRLVPLSVEPAFLELPWPEQMRRLIADISSVSAPQEGGIVLVLSEVCWATGLRIPISELTKLLDEIRDRTAVPYHIIIDGAHAVGNAAPPYPTEIADAYVFSGHKWLLAPEPCGILVSKSATEVFDAWVGDVPIATAGSSVVCGLRAALRIISNIPIDKRRERINTLKSRLLSLIADYLRPVGQDVGLEETSLFALKPAPGFKWKHPPPELRRTLSAKGVNAAVISGLDSHAEEAWLRVSVPFYSDWGEVMHFAAALKELVTAR